MVSKAANLTQNGCRWTSFEWHIKTGYLQSRQQRSDEQGVTSIGVASCDDGKCRSTSTAARFLMLSMSAWHTSSTGRNLIHNLQKSAQIEKLNAAASSSLWLIKQEGAGRCTFSRLRLGFIPALHCFVCLMSIAITLASSVGDILSAHKATVNPVSERQPHLGPPAD